MLAATFAIGDFTLHTVFLYLNIMNVKNRIIGTRSRSRSTRDDSAACSRPIAVSVQQQQQQHNIIILIYLLNTRKPVTYMYIVSFAFFLHDVNVVPKN